MDYLDCALCRSSIYIFDWHDINDQLVIIVFVIILTKEDLPLAQLLIDTGKPFPDLFKTFKLQIEKAFAVSNLVGVSLIGHPPLSRMQ